MGVRVQRRRGELFAVQDVARRACVSASVVYRCVELGLLPERVRVGALWYWLPHQLQAVLRGLLVPRPRRVMKPKARKVTPEQIELMRFMFFEKGERQAFIGELFGLSQGQVSRILRLKTPV